MFTRKREDPDDEDDDDDPAVGQVVVARVRVDDGAPAVDGDDDDGEGRDENVGACKIEISVKRQSGLVDSEFDLRSEGCEFESSHIQ